MAGKVKNTGAASIGELLRGSTAQFRLLINGEGDVSRANAVATQVRSHVSLISLAIKMHKMGAPQDVLKMAKSIEAPKEQ